MDVQQLLFEAKKGMDRLAYVLQPPFEPMEGTKGLVDVQQHLFEPAGHETNTCCACISTGLVEGDLDVI